MLKTVRSAVGVLIVVGLGFLVWSLAAGFSEEHGFAGKPAIRFSAGASGNITVEVEGLGAEALSKLKRLGLPDKEWSAILSVYPGAVSVEDSSSVPAMLGAYEVDRSTIRFIPRFPLVEGLTYAAQFDFSRFAEKCGEATESPARLLRASYTVPKDESAPATKVTAIYPTASYLPANQLKLYIQFSAPMSEGEAFDRVHLIEESGKEVQMAFLRLEHELWDEERQQLTLWFDPGRIKRGLGPNLKYGPPLGEGKRYRLVIDGAWRDGRGRPLGERFEKFFTASAPDRTAPDYKQWKLIIPRPNTSEPLAIVFPEPLDRALLESMIEVRDASGSRLAGKVEVGEGQLQWRFTPARAWQEGGYRVEVDARLEDRAGNSLRGLFDVDLRKSASVLAVSKESIEMRFEVKGE
jgi:hypothetical protein